MRTSMQICSWIHFLIHEKRQTYILLYFIVICKSTFSDWFHRIAFLLYKYISIFLSLPDSWCLMFYRNERFMMFWRRVCFTIETFFIVWIGHFQLIKFRQKIIINKIKLNLKNNYKKIKDFVDTLFAWM